MATWEAYAFDYQSTLAVGCAPGDTVLTVTDAVPLALRITSGAGQWRLRVGNELMIVTNVAGGVTLTVVRGQENTSAVSHLAGTTLAHVVSPASIARVGEMSYPFGTQAIQRAKLAAGEYVSEAASQAFTLLDTSIADPNTGGYVEHIWLGTNLAQSHDAVELATLNVYIDGNNTPDISVKGGSIWMTPWSSSLNWDSGNIGFKWVGNDGAGFLKIRIPFTTSIKITLTNGDASHSAQFFWDISYKLTPGFSINWGRAKRLKMAEKFNVSVAKYVDTLWAQVSGRGLIYGWNAVFKGGDGNVQFLEGNPSIKIDGENVASMAWSGTEDYFLSGGYFNGGPRNLLDHGNPAINSGTGLAAAYRFHLDDPVPFESGFEFHWPNGDQNEATVVNNTSIYGVVMYYLDQ